MIILILILSVIYPCTIGVAIDNNGDAFLWKNRDNAIYLNDSIPTIENEMIHIDNSENENLLSYVCVKTRGDDKTYMGLNENGFGIINSVVLNNSDTNSEDQLRTYDEWQIFNESLQECSSINCFENKLNIELNSNRDIIISSNFGIVDSSGNGSIFEVNNYQQTNIHRIDLTNDNSYILRTNHFKIINNPNVDDLDLLNGIDCSDQFIETSDNLLGNFLRYCASEKKFEDNFNNGQSIINSLISTNNGLLRSLNKSDQPIEFYTFPYTSQAVYDNGKGRPAGYIYSNFSVARANTVSSIIIKSKKHNPSESFMLTALGNPLITPYIPFKVNDDYNQNTIDLIETIVDNSIELRQKIFDFDTNNEYHYKRYIDSQHLYPINGNSVYPNPNHDGFFSYLNNIEQEYFNVQQETIESDLYSILDNVINNYYTPHLDGFNIGNYDEPRYAIGFQTDQGETNCYDGRRIVDRTLHRHHEKVNKWIITNSDNNNRILEYENQNYLNPYISKSNWHDLGRLIDSGDIKIELYDSNTLLRERIMYAGCDDSTSYNYSENIKIDNESCHNGDSTNNGVLDVSDIILLVEYILTDTLPNNADICRLNVNGSLNTDIDCHNPDNFQLYIEQINVCDVILLIEIILQ